MYIDLLLLLLLLLLSLQTSLSSSQCPNTSQTIPQHCPYFNNRPLDQSTPLLTSSSNCYWYAPQACCTFLEAELVVGETAYNLFTESSVECLDLLNLLVCYVCSPNQTNFYKPGQLFICGDFCDRIFSTCATSIWKGNTLEQQFANSSHFCLSRGYTVIDGYDTNTCFNSGWKYIFGIFLFISAFSYTESQLLATDVNEWADSLGSFTQSVTRDILKIDSLQNTFNSANYSHLHVNGSLLRDEMSGELSLVYQEAVQAVNTLADTTEQLFDAQCNSNEYSQYTNLDSLREAGLFYDSDTTTFPQNSNRTSVKISDSVNRDTLIADIAITANLTNTFINIQRSSQYISRQYFASVNGFLREFPAREWEKDFIGFPKEYDPRLQTWYHVATSRPKDVVIVVDCSSSMLENNRWQLAISTIEIILRTLTQEDFINIICSASSVYLNQDSSTPTYIDARVLSPCSEDGLMPATSGVKRHLIGLLKEEQPVGGSDHRDALTLAFKLLWNRSRECEPLILFLTDGEASDAVLCRPATYFGTEEGVLFVPGPRCVYDFNQLYEHVNRLEADYTETWDRDEIIIIGFALSETATTLPYNISCSHGGFGLKITNNVSIYSQLSQYFTYTNQNTTQIVLLNPYGGGDGQLILTAVKSVYSKCGGVNRLIGVIGVDYSLSAVQVVLAKARSDNSYGFIINRFGEALFHPRIDPTARLIPNPIYPPLSSLETCPKDSNISLCSDNPSVLDVEAAILLSGNTTGEFKVLNVPRVTLRGDHQDGVEWRIGNSNYYYSPIHGTSFILGLNLEDSFLDQFVLSSLPIGENYTQPFYNIFSEYSQETLETFGLEPPSFCATSSTPFNISTNQSLIVLAPISVCNPSNFRINNIPGPLTVYNYFSNFSNQTITDLFEGCKSEKEYFKDRLLSSILLTSLLGVNWQQTNASGIVWRYIGLENGVLRILPGVEIGTDYDPTVRPWYRRAVAQENMLAISYVYLDAGGAGKTVTLSRAIFTGPPSPLNSTNCSNAGCYCSNDEECISGSCIPDLHVCSSDRIAGVTAFDYTYTEFSSTFYSYLNSLDNFNCAKENHCYLYIFDSQTFLILANEILDADPADTNAYERVSLGRMQPEVVRDLVDRGLLVEDYSFDFQSRCLYSSYFLPATENNLTLFQDNGQFSPYQNEYSCLQTVRNFYINSTLVETFNGSVYGAISPINNCRYGDYYVSPISGTNAFLLVLNNWTGSEECPLDPSAQSGPTLNLTGGTQCSALFSQIQITTSYSCSTPIYTQECDPASGGAPIVASSILIGLISFLLLCISN